MLCKICVLDVKQKPRYFLTFLIIVLTFILHMSQDWGHQWYCNLQLFLGYLIKIQSFNYLKRLNTKELLLLVTSVASWLIPPFTV